MILTLAEAQKVSPDITQNDLDAFETMVRTVTKNRFQVKGARIRSLTFTEMTLTALSVPSWVIVGATLQVSATELNDGLYEVEAINGNDITLKGAAFIPGTYEKAYASLIRYPADVKAGVLKLIEYAAKTADKVGVKSESISRYNVTYFDLTAGETKNGYPAYLMEFLKNYEKVGWGV